MNKLIVVFVVLALAVWFCWPRSTHVTPVASELRGSVEPGQPMSGSNPPNLANDDMIAIYRMYGKSMDGIVLYYDADTQQLLEWDEVNCRFQNPPGFFERHFRISEVIGLLLIIGIVGGGGGISILTITYSLAGATTGYARSYVSGVDSGSNSGSGGGCLGIIMIAAIIYYYCYLSSPAFGKVCGVCIDCFLWFLGYVFSGGPLTR